MARTNAVSAYQAAQDALEHMQAAIPAEHAMDDEDRIVYANFLIQYSIALSLYDLARK